MGKKPNSLQSLLPLEIINALLHAGNMEAGRLTTTMGLLIKARIPFELTYTPATRQVPGSATLTIYINPTATLNLVYPL